MIIYKEVVFDENDKYLLMQSGYQEANILLVPLMLSLGDITASDFSKNRKLLQFRYFPSCAEYTNSDIDAALQILDSCRSNSAAIRIWYDDAPDRLCGAYYIVSQMTNAERKIVLKPLPKIGSLMNKSQIVAGSLSQDAQKTYSEIWAALEKENAPLRILDNSSGYIVSVGIDYFDDFMVSLTHSRGKIATYELITSITKLCPICVPFIVERIKLMIEHGIFRILNDNPDFYLQYLVLHPPSNKTL